MTQKRDLKRLVRERQARTGESYVTAHRHVTAHRPTASIPVVELIDVSPQAAQLGMRGEVRAFPEVLARVDTDVALTRLRDALLATPRDPGTRAFREILIDGYLPNLSIQSMPEMFQESVRFAARVRARIAGPSEGGRMLALEIDGRERRELIVFAVWPVPMMPGITIQRTPFVILTSIEAMGLAYEDIIL